MAIGDLELLQHLIIEAVSTAVPMPVPHKKCRLSWLTLQKYFGFGILTRVVLIINSYINLLFIPFLSKKRWDKILLLIYYRVSHN